MNIYYVSDGVASRHVVDFGDLNVDIFQFKSAISEASKPTYRKGMGERQGYWNRSGGVTRHEGGG